MDFSHGSRRYYTALMPILVVIFDFALHADKVTTNGVVITVLWQGLVCHQTCPSVPLFSHL